MPPCCVFIVMMSLGPKCDTGRPRAASIAALLLLCLLWACDALRVDLLPSLQETAPYLQRQVLPLVLLSISAAAIAIARGAIWRCVISDSVWIGLGLFAVPAGLVYWADAWIHGLSRIALFTLTLVFAVVFEPYLGLASAQRQRGGLLAALVAVAGALLVFPVATPDSLQSAAALTAVVIAAASVAAATCHGTAKAAVWDGNAAGSLAAMASIAGAAAALTLAVASALLEPPAWRWNALAPELLWSASVELPALLLLFWLMPRISAPRMTTRYVLGPLLALLAGIVAEQAGRAVRSLTWLGLALMALGASWILFAPKDESNRSILSLDGTRKETARRQ
jgi:hypothetical protein